MADSRGIAPQTAEGPNPLAKGAMSYIVYYPKNSIQVSHAVLSDRVFKTPSGATA